jgi:uncharacterized protein
MPSATYSWALYDEFVGRGEDLAAMDEWWAGRDRKPLNVYGRRRVGKSWLLRAFAHGKPAVLLVAERVPEGTQLARFADQLAGELGVRPDLPDVPSLVRTLYRLGRDRKLLVVIDEFPYLLPAVDRRREEVLTAIQAVLEEERDRSRTKLVVCGSHVAQMEELMAAGSALYGRLTRLAVEPFTFEEALPFFEPSAGAAAAIERYAVAGGMPMYLAELARGDLAAAICKRVLDRRGPLFDDPRRILEQELRQPQVYFALLEALAGGAKSIDDLASALRMKAQSLTAYLRTLREMRLVERVEPSGGEGGSQRGRYRLADGFMRFWFRFVFRFQDDLAAGLRPRDLYEGTVKPALAAHVAPEFEQVCRAWTRRHYGRLASRVGTWWGPALHELRRSGERQSEEIDVVGLRDKRVTVVGECRWRTRPMGTSVLDEIETHKLPALVQGGARLPKGGPLVLLFSRAGFGEALVRAAEADERVRLVAVDELIA